MDWYIVLFLLAFAILFLIADIYVRGPIGNDHRNRIVESFQKGDTNGVQATCADNPTTQASKDNQSFVSSNNKTCSLTYSQDVLGSIFSQDDCLPNVDVCSDILKEVEMDEDPIVYGRDHELFDRNFVRVPYDVEGQDKLAKALFGNMTSCKERTIDCDY